MRSEADAKKESEFRAAPGAQFDTHFLKAYVLYENVDCSG